MKKILFIIPVISLCLFTDNMLFGQTPLPKITIGVDEAQNPQDFGLTIQILFLITILSLAPSILIMMTSFTRLLIVFNFIRSALATQAVPSNQILIGLSLFISVFIMKPVFLEINDTALQPYLNEQITQEQALENASVPIKSFMLDHTREKDLELFIDLQADSEPSTLSELSIFTWVN